MVPIDLPVVFRPWGPFPGVTAVTNQPESWNFVGGTRNPQLTDGSTATETLTEYTYGSSFAYEITGFTNMLGHLVSGVRGEWTGGRLQGASPIRTPVPSTLGADLDEFVEAVSDVAHINEQQDPALLPELRRIDVPEVLNGQRRRPDGGCP